MSRMSEGERGKEEKRKIGGIMTKERAREREQDIIPLGLEFQHAHGIRLRDTLLLRASGVGLGQLRGLNKWEVSERKGKERKGKENKKKRKRKKKKIQERMEGGGRIITLVAVRLFVGRLSARLRM